MKKERFVLAFFTGCLMSAVSLQAQTSKDSTKVARSYAINEVVVTGTRSETDVRHLPMTVSVAVSYTHLVSIDHLSLIRDNIIRIGQSP